MSRVSVEWRSTSKENYIDFCKTHPSITISFTDWKNILYMYSEWFKDYILETGEKVKLPNGLGEFGILKKKRMPSNPEKERKVKNLPIDWPKTRLKGKYIYFLNYETEGFTFKWMWNRRPATFKYTRLWYFKPSRASSRLLAHYLKVDPKYQHLYSEWKDLLKRREKGTVKLS